MQAVVFDFDGILVDSEPAHYRAFQRVLQPLGLGYGWDTYKKDYIGLADREAFSAVLESADRVPDRSILDRLIAEKAAVFEEELQAGLTPLPGAIQCVYHLAAQIPLALCSGALRREIFTSLGHLELLWQFRVIIGAEDVAYSKPDPSGYRMAIARLGQHLGRSLEPMRCVAVEDTPAGIASAQGAGLKTIAVTHTHPREVFKGADWIIDSLTELTTEGLTGLNSLYSPSYP